MERMNQATRSQLATITDSLAALERYQLEEEAREAARVATDANAAAVDALDRVGAISTKLEGDLEAAYGLAREMEGARKAIQLASEQGESGRRGWGGGERGFQVRAGFGIVRRASTM